jgi:hypothetical protein
MQADREECESFRKEMLNLIQKRNTRKGWANVRAVPAGQHAAHVSSTLANRLVDKVHAQHLKSAPSEKPSMHPQPAPESGNAGQDDVKPKVLPVIDAGNIRREVDISGCHSFEDVISALRALCGTSSFAEVRPLCATVVHAESGMAFRQEGVQCMCG